MSNDRDKSLPRARTAADELPPPDTKRWTPRPKAAVVEAVLSGVTTIEEVCRRCDLTVKKFLSGQNMMNMHGPPGLRVPPGSRLTAIRPGKSAETARSRYFCNQ